MNDLKKLLLGLGLLFLLIQLIAFSWLGQKVSGLAIRPFKHDTA
jgi:hypothetical protein